MELLHELLLTASLSLVVAFFFFSRNVPAAVATMTVQSLPPTAEVEGGEPPRTEEETVDVDFVDRRIVEVTPEEVEEDKEVELEKWEGEGEGETRELWIEEEWEGETRELWIEEEWEGVERSELERVFGAAVAFADGEIGMDALSKVGGDVQMKLYGLQKVAMEGPCYESPPIALKISARSRWHAWQKLGNMDRETAMEQYIALLSNNVPGWIEGRSSAESECTAEGQTSSHTEGPDSLTSKNLLEHGESAVQSERNLDIN